MCKRFTIDKNENEIEKKKRPGVQVISITLKTSFAANGTATNLLSFSQQMLMI